MIYELITLQKYYIFPISANLLKKKCNGPTTEITDTPPYLYIDLLNTPPCYSRTIPVLFPYNKAEYEQKPSNLYATPKVSPRGIMHGEQRVKKGENKKEQATLNVGCLPRIGYG